MRRMARMNSLAASAQMRQRPHRIQRKSPAVYLRRLMIYSASSTMAIFWIILLRGLWVALLLISRLITLLMFAFADSPDAGKAAKKMIGPVFMITLLIFAG